MAFELLLREGQINSMKVRNRIITGPAERSMANRDGTMTQAYIDFFVERARGGAGLILIESTYVDTRGMGHLYQVGCHEDHVIPGLKRLADAIHTEGAKVGLELYMGGRQTPSYMSLRQPIAPSVVPCKLLNPVPTPREMTRDDIKEAVQRFADAAQRVAIAGIDFIEMHGAHGYLLGAFLSPYSNKRTDEYGGSIENRARFALEVLSAIRKVVGPEFPIGYRISADEYIDDGLTIHDTVKFCKILADAGIDLIDVSGGIYESFHIIIQGPEAPKGGFVSNASAIKKAVGDKTKVSVTQRLNDPEFANEVIRREGLDFISMTRAFHADPQYVKKLIEGRLEDIIPCIACHHCTNLLEANMRTLCSTNPRTGLERIRRFVSVSKPRKIMVVGGGPGGMQVARLLSEQGNHVMLYEKNNELGGQVRYSSQIAEDYAYLITYLKTQMEKLKVDVHLGTEVNLNIINKVSPDALVVATGSSPGLLFCPVKGKPKIFDVFSSFERPDDDWEDLVVLIGGDSVTCALSLYIAGRGAEVHIVEPKSELSTDKMSPGKDLLLIALKDLPTINMRLESTVEQIGEEYVIIQKHGEFERLENVGSVVIGGRIPNNKLYEETLRSLPDIEVYNIGDSVMPHEIHNATYDAAQVAELIRLKAY